MCYHLKKHSNHHRMWENFEKEKALAFLKIQEAKIYPKMKVLLEIQSICLMFAGREKPELFIQWVIIHLRAPHLLTTHGCGLWPEQVQRGGGVHRQACVQKWSLVFSDSASLITNTLRWRWCEEPLSWSRCLTQEKKSYFWAGRPEVAG